MSIVIWEWKDDSCWCAYKPKVSNFIEDFYQQSQSGSGFLQLGGADLEMSPYEINICTLQQRRVSTGIFTLVFLEAGFFLKREILSSSCATVYLSIENTLI